MIYYYEPSYNTKLLLGVDNKLVFRYYNTPFKRCVELKITLVTHCNNIILKIMAVDDNFFSNFVDFINNHARAVP